MTGTGIAPNSTRGADLIADDAEALRVAAELAALFAPGAVKRDAQRILPVGELDHLSSSGLLAILVPAEHGGADVSAHTLAEVFRLLAHADPNIAQIPQSHFAYVNVLRHQGSPSQQSFFFAEILNGKRLGNAQSETGTKHIQDIRTTLQDDGDGVYRLTGVKGYSTGALFADWIPVLAHLGPDGPLHVAFVERDADGVTVIDDWSGMGQRTTASGTVRLDGVRVPCDRIVPHHLTFTGPQLYGALAQLLHAAIDVGIAGAALDDAADFVRTKSRPWFESGADRATEDPLVIQRVGELAIAVLGAEALLSQAAREIDVARADLTDHRAGRASIAVATARTVGAKVAVDVASALFEVAGTRSSLDELNLNRHWRNARTHTLHDPTAWKIQHIGRYILSGTLPPRHGLL